MENLSVYQMFQEFTLKSLRKFRKISLQIPQNILIRKSCWQLELSGSIVATKYYYPVVLGYGTGTGPDANDSPLHTPNAVMVVQNITSCSLMVLLWWCICWVVCTICILPRTTDTLGLDRTGNMSFLTQQDGTPKCAGHILPVTGPE